MYAMFIFRAPIAQGYGLTETCAGAAFSGWDDTLWAVLDLLFHAAILRSAILLHNEKIVEFHNPEPDFLSRDGYMNFTAPHFNFY